ncbi:signal peptidase II [Sulfuritalea hydrogenivorans]|uniref:Lipoprotein signal peptidase n=1 Tax=Sulfuritalea hydrogenivorans sk43H TaxID=1223802 RepID=W0SBN6_9PROT|nr:signal peptidase II [Sulfuritalea hydrogenivorans]BAO28634.1 lipoprotein signal peptidase [Sulfuritalea hydrogenivorans sk43H]
MPKSASSLARWLALALLVLVLDQVSKAWVLANFRLMDRQVVTSFFNLVLVFNPGASFSFLADAGGWQKWFFVTLALGISAWLLVMLRKHAGERLLSAALALILGGALGNVIDRLRFDAVVDFLDFHLAGYHWPAFNVADSSIFVGVALMLLHQFLQPKEAP